MSREGGPPELVVFDCDGTLVDSARANRLFYNGIKTGLGLDPLTPEEEAFSFVQPVPLTLERIIPEELLERAREAAAKTDWASLSAQVRLQEGAAEYVRDLKEAGIKRAVDTNGGREVRTVLSSLGLGGSFDLIVSAEDVSRAKPNPEGVRLILGRLGVRPGGTAYIGDSLVDQQTAANAGVAFWAYRAPDLEAKLHFDDYRSLDRPPKAGPRPVTD